MVDAAVEGELIREEFEIEPTFGFSIPKACHGVPPNSESPQRLEGQSRLRQGRRRSPQPLRQELRELRRAAGGQGGRSEGAKVNPCRITPRSWTSGDKGSCAVFVMLQQFSTLQATVFGGIGLGWIATHPPRRPVTSFWKQNETRRERPAKKSKAFPSGTQCHTIEGLVPHSSITKCQRCDPVARTPDNRLAECTATESGYG